MFFDIPEEIKPYLSCASMLRLKKIDMNCGVNFTSLPIFCNLSPYSRYDHSLRVASIIYYFTNDLPQTLSGLFHDISTPAFSHTIDFLNGDYINQESTEKGTRRMIEKDVVLQQLLNNDGISISSVCDYHMYPIADNDSPKLSSDRLEYTLSNGVNYHFICEEEIEDIFYDIQIGINEMGEEEMMFKHEIYAERFAQLALKCGMLYSSKQDRYAMEMLAHLIKEYINQNILTYEDLYTDEQQVIQKIKDDPKWIQYTNLSNVIEDEAGMIIPAKKRYIDPYVLGKGRMSQISDTIKNEIDDFLYHDLQNEKLIGVFKNGR